MKKLLPIAIFWVFAISPFQISAQNEAEIFPLSELKNEYFLNGYLSVLTETKDENLNPETVLSDENTGRFKPYKISEKDSLVLERDKIHWGKIIFQNRLKELNTLFDWKLFIGNANYVEVYLRNDAGILSSPEIAGNLAPASKKNLDFANRQLRVNLTLEGHQPQTVLIKITGRNHKPTTFGVKLVKYDFFQNWDFLRKAKRNWLFLGFLLTMVMFNFLMFLGTRDRAFFYHFLFLFGVMVYLFEFFGILEDAPFFREHPIIIQNCTYVMLTLMDLGYLMFIREYMHLSDLLPKWDWVLKWLIRFRVLLMVLTLSLFGIIRYEPFTDKITAIYLISEYLFLVFFMTILYRTGDKKAWFLIAGTLLVVIGVVLNSMAIVWGGGVINATFTQWGLIGEILLFSMGLAYRMKLLRQEEQEAQRLKDLNDFKERFYTNITHEFRTPLTVIQGMADQLKDEPGVAASSKSKEAVRLIERSGTNLLNLVNQMLDLSKLESGRMSLNKKTGDIVAYLRYLTDSYHSFANSKNIHLQFLTDMEKLDMDFDAEKTQQIHSNLLSNAFKITPEGGKITVLVKKQIGRMSGAEKIFLSVKDSGIGIEPSTLPHIFERFYQADNSAKKPGQGTGVGLALTKELVQLMGGKIEVESEVGKGTEFRVILPVGSRHPAPPTPIGEPPPSKIVHRTSDFAHSGDQPSTDSPLLLLLEDSPDIIQYLRSLLENDYEILTAYDGKMGIEKAIERVPDIIISDVMMPEKDGFEVCETLKNDERTSHIPIILLTAKATVEDRLTGLSRGADAFLAKPFKKEELFIRLEKLVESRRKLQARFGKSDSLEDAFIEKVRNLVEADLSNADFGIAQLCRALGMSRAQVHRKITALTGRSTSLLIRSFRLEKAKSLLLTTELTISEIAYDVGFSDPNYFTRTYVEEFDETPSETRN